MQVRHGVFEQRQQLRQAEVGHLRGNMIKHIVLLVTKNSRFKNKNWIMVPISLWLQQMIIFVESVNVKKRSEM